MRAQLRETERSIRGAEINRYKLLVVRQGWEHAGQSGLPLATSVRHPSPAMTVYPLFLWRWPARAVRIKGQRLWPEPMASAGSKKPVNDRCAKIDNNLMILKWMGAAL